MKFVCSLPTAAITTPHPLHPNRRVLAPILTATFDLVMTLRDSALSRGCHVKQTQCTSLCVNGRVVSQLSAGLPASIVLEHGDVCI